MKTLFILCLLSVSLLSAQGYDSLFYGNTKKVLRNPYGWGYIAGTNSYADAGKYQQFDVKEEMNVIGAKFWMGLKRIVNTPDSITIVFKKAGYGKSYYDTLSGGPGATIASIQTTLASFDTSAAGGVFLLSTPFNVAGSAIAAETVFVGIEWSAAMNDTFALCSDSAGQGEKKLRSWERTTQFSFLYQRFDEPNAYSWGLDADLWIALLYKKGLLPVHDIKTNVPKEFSLAQNYPNPFNPSTTIRFSVKTSGMITLTVFDMIGKEVAVLVNKYLDAGEYTSAFTARSLSSGMYFYQLRSGSAVETKRMVLLK